MTKLDIMNRALAAIGHDRTIASVDEQSTEAVRCRQFYLPALRNVLAARSWDFATAEATLAAEGDVVEWPVPDDLVRLVSVRDAAGRTVGSARRAGRLVVSGRGLAGSGVTIRYVSAADPDGSTIEEAMPHLVAEAVAHELAALLFGPMVGNVQDQQGRALFESYRRVAAERLDAAMAADEAEKAFMGGNRTDGSVAETDLANRALAKLGAQAVVTDISTDPSPLAARARLLFPTSVRNILRRRDWDFAAAEETATLAAADPEGYARFPYPPGCVRVCRAEVRGGGPVPVRRSRDELLVRSCGGEVTVRYVTSDIDLAEAPDDFLDLVAMDLAVRLAPTVAAKPEAVASVRQLLEAQLAEVSFNESNETADPGEWRNPLVAARG